MWRRPAHRSTDPRTRSDGWTHWKGCHQRYRTPPCLCPGPRLMPICPHRGRSNYGGWWCQYLREGLPVSGKRNRAIEWKNVCLSAKWTNRGWLACQPSQSLSPSWTFFLPHLMFITASLVQGSERMYRCRKILICNIRALTVILLPSLDLCIIVPSRNGPLYTLMIGEVWGFPYCWSHWSMRMTSLTSLMTTPHTHVTRMLPHGHVRACILNKER